MRMLHLVNNNVKVVGALSSVLVHLGKLCEEGQNQDMPSGVLQLHEAAPRPAVNWHVAARVGTLGTTMWLLCALPACGRSVHSG
jgi:hypothetical protein